MLKKLSHESPLLLHHAALQESCSVAPMCGLCLKHQSWCVAFESSCVEGAGDYHLWNITVPVGVLEFPLSAAGPSLSDLRGGGECIGSRAGDGGGCSVAPM